jgi:hypothetical protein
LEKNNSTKNLMVLNFNEIKKRLIFYANTKKKLLQVTQFWMFENLKLIGFKS